jgi:hypothetical protein
MCGASHAKGQAMNLAGHNTAEFIRRLALEARFSALMAITAGGEQITGVSQFGMSDDGFNRRVDLCASTRLGTDVAL